MLKYRGRFLGRNPDWRLKSFPPCYSQSPLQLCLEISVSLNSHNFLCMFLFKLTQPLTYLYSSVIVHCKREIEEIHTEISSPRTLKILPRNLNKIVRSWIRLQYSKATVQTSGFYISNGSLLYIVRKVKIKVVTVTDGLHKSTLCISVDVSCWR